MTRPRVMGIVNVTPDSFSDGGLYADAGSAVEHGRQLIADGADLLDIGGESTRPGAIRPVVSEELDRVIPVITQLVAEGAVISVDTMRASVAAAALAAGAQVVNDVSGGLADPEILDVVAQSDATYVAMHWRAHATDMADFTDYGPDGVLEGVRRELGERLAAIVAAGIDPEPGAPRPRPRLRQDRCAELGAAPGLASLESLGRPLLIGASRKSFLGSLLAVAGQPRVVGEREFAHVALVALLAQRGVDCLRVHDVRATCDALAVVDALSAGGVAPVGGVRQGDVS